MAQKKSNQNSNIYSVEILSADNMGRIITTGCKAFDFGILLPQFILLDGNPIPFDSSIAFIKGMLSKSEKIEVKPMRFIEKQNSKFENVVGKVDNFITAQEKLNKAFKQEKLDVIKTSNAL